MKEYFAKLKYLFKWKDLAFTVVLFAGILAIALFRGESMMDVTFGDTAVDINTSRYNMNIPYGMVESIELGEVNEDDDLVSGVSDLALRTGTWTNTEWGEYSACVDVQTSKCIIVHLNDGRLFVFSHKSDEKVESDFAIFQSYLDKQ